MKTPKLKILSSACVLGLLVTAAAQTPTPPPATEPASPTAEAQATEVEQAVRNAVQALVEAGQAAEPQTPAPAPAPAQPSGGNQGAPRTQSAPGNGTNLTALISAGAVPTGSANPTAGAPEDKTLRLNFRNVPLDQVLQYLSEAAGFVISSKVPVTGRVSVWAERPLGKKEAVKILNDALTENGYGAFLMDDGTLKIATTQEVKNMTDEILRGSNPDEMPNTDEVVIQVVPIKNVDAAQLIQTLQPLLPQGMTLQASSGANAIVVQDTRAHIRRMALIIRALDTPLAASSVIKVYALTYADAKSIATVIQNLFQPQGGRAGAAAALFGGGGRGGGGRGGGGFGGPGGFAAALFGGGGGGNNTGRISTPQVVATSDDRANAVVVSATEEQIAMIDALVKDLDVNVEEITELRVFHLTHADPGDISSQLATLFPNTSTTQQGGGRGQQFQAFGGGRGGRGAAAAADTSGRMTKQTQVTAVADYRTSSIIVGASRALMPQIEVVIRELDADPSGEQKSFSFPFENQDPEAALSILQSLFPNQSGTVGRTTAGQTGGTFNRTATGAQTGNTGTGLGGGLGTGGNRGGGGGIQSDRNIKTNFVPVDTEAVLAKVASLPITTWNYKADTDTRHLGPMAQDFHAAFGVGADDKQIAVVDQGGVALAAIQGLNRKLEEKDAKIQALEKEVSELKALVQQLVAKSNGGPVAVSGK